MRLTLKRRGDVTYSLAGEDEIFNSNYNEGQSENKRQSNKHIVKVCKYSFQVNVTIWKEDIITPTKY